MLVGPESPFFYRLAKDLRIYANKLHKINLSGGCFIFYPFEAINYRGDVQSFGKFLIDFVEKEKIDTVIMFNDGKLVHRMAKSVLKDKVEYFVIEKGYIRPHFITFEREGVNGKSPLLDVDIETIINTELKPLRVVNFEDSVFMMNLYATIFYLSFVLLKPFFPSSGLVFKNINRLALGRIISSVYRLFLKISDKKVDSMIDTLKGKYYFIPLQVHNDVQIRLYSDYSDISLFIEEIIISFSKNAPEKTHLIIKHHPMDLGFKNYSKFITDVSRKLGVEDRVKYIKSGNIDKLIENSIGCVTINSTVGMTALMKRKPVKVMGKAIYDKPGLTYQGPLDNFWKDSLNFTVDEELINKFIYYVMENALINGSLYKKINRKNNAGVYYQFYDI